MDRIFFIVGSLVALLGVAAGAFGTHGLSAHFRANPELETTFRTGVTYHILHALALILAGVAAGRWPGWMTTGAGYSFLAGIVVFSGSLYALTLSQARWLGAITPLGGLAFLAGWALLALGVWRA